VHHRRVHGKPNPLIAMPVLAIADRIRWGRVGWYVARSRRIQGWVRNVEAVALAQASYQLPADAVIVEVGSFLGCSAVLLAGARKLRGSGRLHCIDPFDASGDAFSVPVYRAIARRGRRSLRRRFERNITRAGLADWVHVHQGLSSDIVRTWSEPIDLLFLDGDHAHPAARRTFDEWRPFLKPGAIVAIHNSSRGYRRENHDGSARLGEYVADSPEFEEVSFVDSLTFARIRI
jgi:predicted O-methyltransferase YrrM